jgi:hypothetical protein
MNRGGAEVTVVSREAAEEYSPWRKPWGESGIEPISEGAKDKL